MELDFHSDSINFHERVYIGDYNGDGKTDILSSVPPVFSGTISYTSWKLHISTGSGLITKRIPFGNISHLTEDNRILAGDINGDGKSDVVVCGIGEHGNSVLAVKLPKTGI